MKKLTAILLILSLLACFGITVFAENDGVSLCSTMVMHTIVNLSFTEDGWARMTAEYEGFADRVEGAHVVFTLQKQGWLWFIWDDIARWSDIEMTGTNASRTISYPLESGGNYKLIVDFTFYNSAGETEQLRVECEASY